MTDTPKQPEEINSPFERVPQHKDDPGFGPVPPKSNVEYLRENAALPKQPKEARPASRHEVMHCPSCGVQHIDEGEWSTRQHHKHLCLSCGRIWRVEPYTFGIQNLTEKSGWFWGQVKKSIDASKKWPEWMGEKPWLKK